MTLNVLSATGSLQDVWSMDGTLQSVIEDTAAERDAIETCCCGGGVGCCSDKLISGQTVLQVEVISDASGCFTVGETINMDDLTSPEIWYTNGNCFGENNNWGGMELTCGETDLALTWSPVDCGCPEFPELLWVLESGQCDPFEWIYSYEIREDESTACLCDGQVPSGTVRVKITIA